MLVSQAPAFNGAISISGISESSSSVLAGASNTFQPAGIDEAPCVSTSPSCLPLFGGPPVIDETKMQFVVAENVPENRQQAGEFLLDTFGRNAAQLHYASNSLEAIAAIDRIESVPGLKVSLIVTDLHMTEDGSGNGDVLLEHLMTRGKTSPPIAIASGTFLDEARRELAERLPFIPLLDKGAFRAYSAASPAAENLAQTLKRLVAGEFPPLPVDETYLHVIRSMKTVLDGVSKMGVFIDEVLGKLGRIWGRYGRELAQIKEAQDAIKHVKLYDKVEITGVALHEFKNKLGELIDLLKEKNVSDSLMKELNALWVYVSAVFMHISRGSECNGLENIVRSVSSRFKRDSERILVHELNKTPLAIGKITVERVIALVAELIGNALRHSNGPVELSLENGGLKISNATEHTLPFVIHENKLTSGNLPSGSTSDAGTGIGLYMVIKAAQEMGILFSMSERGGRVEASVNFGKLVAKIEEADAKAEAVDHSVKLPNILFLDHDRVPEETFRDLLSYEIPGFLSRALDYPKSPIAYNLGVWMDEHDALLKSAALLVVHAWSDSIFLIFTALTLRYPHLVFLPASSTPKSMNFENFVDYFKAGLQEFAGAAAMLPYSSDAFGESLPYYTSYPQDVWTKIVEAAHKIALQKHGI